MPTYIMLSTLSPDGAARLVDYPDRLLEVNREVESMGAKVLSQYAVLGQYDFVTILEAADEVAMSKVALQLAQRGTLKTLTLSAIPVERFVEEMRSLGQG